MTKKRLTVVLYGCDRNLWRGGTLDIRVSDIFASGGPRVLERGKTDASVVELQLSLPFDAGQLYGITFSAPGHRPAWQLIRRADFIRLPENVEGDHLILRLMLVPDSAGTTDLPKAFERLQEIASPFAAPDTGIDAATFQELDVAAKMAFLNIEAKLRETVFEGTPLIAFVRGVRHIAVDRAFLFFDPSLKARMSRAHEFADAPGHGAPKSPSGVPDHPDSWKHTRFAEGNVQLSFSGETVPLPGTRPPLMTHSADVDIDLGRGLAHAKEWLENNVFKPGHKTNQALVYALLYAQDILPRYTLDPAPETTARAVATLRTVSHPAKGRSPQAKGRAAPRSRTRRSPAPKTRASARRPRKRGK